LYTGIISETEPSPSSPRQYLDDHVELTSGTRYVVLKLESLLALNDDCETTTKHHDPDKMSLSEKMELWNNNEVVEPEPTLYSNLPSCGAKTDNDDDDDHNDDDDYNDDDHNDDDDDDDDHNDDDHHNDDDDHNENNSLARALAYSNVISQSRALTWLVSSLQNRLLLQWESDGCEELTVNRIRQQILKALPPERISNKRRPQEHTITFRVMWGHIASRPPTIGLHTIIITACSGNAQAATIEEYLGQTWPGSGTSVLGLLLDLYASSEPSTSKGT
jgi:hypothetical protein